MSFELSFNIDKDLQELEKQIETELSNCSNTFPYFNKYTDQTQESQQQDSISLLDQYSPGYQKNYYSPIRKELKRQQKQQQKLLDSKPKNKNISPTYNLFNQLKSNRNCQKTTQKLSNVKQIEEKQFENKENIQILLNQIDKKIEKEQSLQGKLKCFEEVDLPKFYGQKEPPQKCQPQPQQATFNLNRTHMIRKEFNTQKSQMMDMKRPETPKFKPHLSQKSIDIAQSLGDPMTRLTSNNKKKSTQLQQLQTQLEQEWTFKPKINNKFQQIDDENKSVFERLYEQNEILSQQKEAKRAEKEQQIKNNPNLTFKPDLFFTKNHMFGDYEDNVIDRSYNWLKQKEEKLNLARQTILGRELDQCTFNPSKSPNTINPPSIVSDFNRQGIVEFFYRVQQANKKKQEKSAIKETNWSNKVTIPNEFQFMRNKSINKIQVQQTNRSSIVTLYKDRSKSTNNLKCDNHCINLDSSINQVVNKLHKELITMKIM